MADEELKLAAWQIEKAELTARVEGLETEKDHYRLALAECERKLTEIRLAVIPPEILVKGKPTDKQINAVLRSKLAAARKNDAKSRATAAKYGYCLGCGYRLSYCGKPITAEVKCPKCLVINIYESGFQPTQRREPFDGAESG